MLTSYHPFRGTISILRLADNRTQQIHHFCLGNSSLPTFFLDSSAAHGTVDFYPLQQHLANLGRRVCVHDPPAFGWSGDLLDGEYYYPQAAGTGSLYCGIARM